MAKKRLSLDFDLDNYNDKKIWDYLEQKKVKSKTIKSILNAYLDGVELPKEDIKKASIEVDTEEELLNKDDVDSSVFVGF